MFKQLDESLQPYGVEYWTVRLPIGGCVLLLTPFGEMLVERRDYDVYYIHPNSTTLHHIDPRYLLNVNELFVYFTLVYGKNLENIEQLVIQNMHTIGHTQVTQCAAQIDLIKRAKEVFVCS